MLLVSGLAFAVSYSAADLLRAHTQKLPLATRRAIAAATVADAEEKACLRAAGIGEEMLVLVPGPAAAATMNAARCRALGIDQAALGEADTAASDRLAAAAAEREAARAEAARTPDCERFGRDPAVDRVEEVEAWMAEQLDVGRTNFVAVPTVEGWVFKGSGGTTSTPILCAWADRGRPATAAQ